MKWKRRDEFIEVPILEYLEKLIISEKENGYNLKISIGTDSKISEGLDTYKFATVILIHKFENLGGDVFVGRGGMIISATYYNKFKAKERDLVNERMVFEVGKSVEVAYEIAPLLDLYEIPLEIHADINPDPRFESNKAVQQAIGYILGMGYDFKIKPDSFAATSCADKFC